MHELLIISKTLIANELGMLQSQIFVEYGREVLNYPG